MITRFLVKSLQINKKITRPNSVIIKKWYSDLTTKDIENLHPALLKKADTLQVELSKLEDQMSSGKEFNVEDSKRYNQLTSVVSIYNEFKINQSNLKELEILIEDEDPILKEEALLEIKIAIKDLINSTNKLKIKLLPSHEFAEKPTIMELRPGAGGHEANIFAQDLLNMYIKYCQFNNWPYELISKSDHESGSGIIDATLSINQLGSYDRLRHEAGVHRVQRVPTTETKGRVHTSAAGVVVLPKIDESQNDPNLRKFAPGELRIDVMRASGSGGQHVNTTESAVRIIHIPTGIMVNIQDERSQHKNKERAMTIIRARLAEKELKEKAEKEREQRTGQVSSVDRSDKIRTYNFQQQRVTDHRCNFTLYDLQGCMSGEKLDDIIDQVEKNETDSRSLELIKMIESEEK
ncbi:Mrf1 protein [Martiniozyma asiatica (nom. inval.)]|nr:Mrf1 protein [Martiniozyma asiatica]